jgi:hypothetical protein
MLAEARVSIEAIRTVPAAQLSEATRHAAKQVAELAVVQVDRISELPAHAGETWLAIVNLIRALERAEGALCAPEAWAGLPMVAEALQLLGAAQVQASDAERLSKQRAAGRPPDPDSKAERIRQAVAQRPKASSEAIARVLSADGVEVNARQVRSVRKRADKT